MERPIEHDDLLGEAILEEEEAAVQQQVMQLMYQVTAPRTSSPAPALTV